MISKNIGAVCRTIGKSLDSIGLALQHNPNIDRLQPPMRVVKYGKFIPEVNDVSFVASTATVIGKVHIGKNASVWNGATVRGDVNSIHIGENTTVADRVMIHCSRKVGTTIGNNVIISQGAIVHGCTLEDGCYIGDGSQILDNATVGKNSIIAAGSLVGIGKKIPPNQYWSGIPAKYERQVTQEELLANEKLLAENKELAEETNLEYAKDWQTIEMEEYDYEQEYYRNDSYFRRKTAEEWDELEGKVDGHSYPGRILNSELSARTKPYDGDLRGN